MGFLAGKRLLITGILNNRSIAYGIARACHREGAELAFSYQGERFRDRITEFAAEFGSNQVHASLPLHMLERIERLESYTGEGWEVFCRSPLIQDAVLRNLEIIGEAAKRVSPGLQERHPEIPWRRLGGFRAVLIHRYNGVNMEEVWNIIARAIPILKEQLTAILRDLGRP